LTDLFLFVCKKRPPSLKTATTQPKHVRLLTGKIKKIYTHFIASTDLTKALVALLHSLLGI
jgi:hypothetical protein